MADPTSDVVPALDQGLLALFDRITAMISPDDWARHLPACGYADESPNCRCGQFGADLISLLRSHDATARADERERITVAVEDEREGFLRSDTLDPTWIAGWHAAVDWVAYRLNQRDYPPVSPSDGAA